MVLMSTTTSLRLTFAVVKITSGSRECVQNHSITAVIFAIYYLWVTYNLGRTIHDIVSVPLLPTSLDPTTMKETVWRQMWSFTEYYYLLNHVCFLPLLNVHLLTHFFQNLISLQVCIIVFQVCFTSTRRLFIGVLF